MDKVRQKELVDQIAERIHRWGMSGLASIFLDAFRPLAFMGGQALWVAQPTLNLLMDNDQVADLAQLLEQPEALTMLRARLEEA